MVLIEEKMTEIKFFRSIASIKVPPHISAKIEWWSFGKEICYYFYFFSFYFAFCLYLFVCINIFFHTSLTFATVNLLVVVANDCDQDVWSGDTVCSLRLQKHALLTESEWQLGCQAHAWYDWMDSQIVWLKGCKVS